MPGLTLSEEVINGQERQLLACIHRLVQENQVGIGGGRSYPALQIIEWYLQHPPRRLAEWEQTALIVALRDPFISPRQRRVLNEAARRIPDRT